jgi:hypothetical protein
LLPKPGRIDTHQQAPSSSKEGASAGERLPPKRTQSFGEIDIESIGALAPTPTPEQRLRPYQPGGVGSNRPGPGPAQAKPSQKPTKQGMPAVRRPHIPATSVVGEETPPPRETPTRQGLEAVSRIAQEETRIAKAGVLAEAIAEAQRDHDKPTKIGSLDAPPASSGSRGSRSAPSASGVASRDERVAAIRELYAQGNADAALMIASEVASDFAAATGSRPPPIGSTPPLGADDPYGGLIPIEDDIEIVFDHAADARDNTAVAASPDSRRLVAMTSQSRIPRLLLGPNEIAKLPMDPRAAFLTSFIDGQQTMEEILDVCAMPEAEALELIERLRQLGAISID